MAPRKACASPAAQKVWRGKKTPLASVGFFLLGSVRWGGSWRWYPRALCGQGRAPLGNIQVYFRCSLVATGTRKTSPECSSTFPVLKTRLFCSRSTDQASTSQFSGCRLLRRSPAETSATPCKKSTRLGISASSFCLLSPSSLLLLFQHAKMLYIQKGNHCWIRAAQPPFASSSLQANR